MGLLNMDPLGSWVSRTSIRQSIGAKRVVLSGFRRPCSGLGLLNLLDGRLASDMPTPP
jgi:hypothetical protein